MAKEEKKKIQHRCLNNNQKLFCQLYIKMGSNGTKAYMEVYKPNSEDTARINASKLLTKTNIREYIEKEQEKIANRNNVTIDRVVQEYAKIAFVDARQLFDDKGLVKEIKDIDDDTAGALSTIKVKEDYRYEDGEQVFDGYTKEIKLVDKKGALDSLGKYLGMFTEKTNSQVTVTIDEADKELLKNINSRLNNG